MDRHATHGDSELLIAPVAAITALFDEVLGVSEIETEENFFDLGGNSILALNLISAIQRDFGVSVRLIDVLRSPTAEGIAQLVTEARK